MQGVFARIVEWLCWFCQGGSTDLPRSIRWSKAAMSWPREARVLLMQRTEHLMGIFRDQQFGSVLKVRHPRHAAHKAASIQGSSSAMVVVRHLPWPSHSAGERSLDWLSYDSAVRKILPGHGLLSRRLPNARPQQGSWMVAGDDRGPLIPCRWRGSNREAKRWTRKRPLLVICRFSRRYGPVLVPSKGLEPLTSCSEDKRSIR